MLADRWVAVEPGGVEGVNHRRHYGQEECWMCLLGAAGESLPLERVEARSLGRVASVEDSLIVGRLFGQVDHLWQRMS